MAMRQDGAGNPLQWYDFINPLNYFNGDFYQRLGSSVAQPVADTGKALQQSLTTVPQATSQAAGMATSAVQTGLNTAPKPTQQQVYGANFGTFTTDAMGKLKEMGMLPQSQTQANTGVADQIRGMQNYRSRLDELNQARTNPYGFGSQGYNAQAERITGQAADRFGVQRKGMLSDLASRGITGDSGMTAQALSQGRMAQARSESDMLGQLAAGERDKAAAWDQQDNALRTQIAQASDAGNLSRANMLMNALGQQYEQGRQQPFDQLKLMSGVQDFEQQGRMNPLAYGAAQEQLGRYQKETPLYLQHLAGQNEGQGYQNTFAQSTLYPSISAANYGYNRQATENRLGNEELQYWGQDGNRDYTRGMQHFNRGFKPVADFADAFSKPGGKFAGAMFGTNGGG